MATKKASESFTVKKAGELAEGDRFRSPGAPPWQKVESVEKVEIDENDPETNTKKEIVSCVTSIEGSVEQFRFAAFSKVEVEVLDG